MIICGLWIFFLGPITAYGNTSMSTMHTPQVVKTKENKLLIITVAPQDINQLDTEPLTINCSYQPQPSQSNFVLQSLILTKSDGHVLSSLHVTNPDVPTTPDISVIRPGHVSIKGHLRSTDNLTSYLSVTWDAPTEKEQGTYHCEAVIKDETFSTLHVYRETNVHDNTNIFIKQKIESIDKDMADQKEVTLECRNQIQTNEDRLKYESAICSQKIDSVKTELESQNKTISSNQINILSLQKEFGNQKKSAMVCQDKTNSLEKTLQLQKSDYSKKLKSIQTEFLYQKETNLRHQKTIESLQAELEVQKSEHSVKLNYLETEIAHHKNEITSLQTELKQQKVSMSTCRKTISDYGKTIKSLKSMLDNQENSVLVIGKTIKVLQTELARQKALKLPYEKYARLGKEYSANFYISTLFKNKAYLLSKKTTDGFPKAESECKSMGGYLAEIDDNDDWTFIIGFIKEKKMEHIFIGGKDDIKEGSWYWSHSKRPITFTKWIPGQPDNAGNNEDCLEFWYYRGEFRNNDQPCMSRNINHFLCEIPLFNFS